ncbi:uncharacterized protein LOC112087483 [Eutrema salsugineum]|uniref:uncharacterized protein LOC112087483 n=1 Tax=Eutrema salsugineum TaxID=72664 RepID=UPI000CED39F1|nr:uncharacterized protein LOC112087483 [Eutrema salsugineum]
MLKRIHSFWYDLWCDLGCLYENTGAQGFIDMGIPQQATVGEALDKPRRRRHRRAIYRDIEAHLTLFSNVRELSETDIPRWKGKNDIYRDTFLSKDTWMHIRQAKPRVDWYRGVWFPQTTPKYSFLTWLAFKNRLATGDRIKTWNRNANASCVFCNDPMETRNHLFFECAFAKKVWGTLAKGLLLNRFVVDWDAVTELLISHHGLLLPLFWFGTLSKPLSIPSGGSETRGNMERRLSRRIAWQN